MTTKKKTCFIIMPISDQEGYKQDHFTRVYDYIIKPACIKAGFDPIRADDEIRTNHIVLDIVQKVIESDLAICDLSSKNPNVLYELGLRQAFNKKTVLIKDKITNRIFDIQGLRTIDYDESLRIDEVEKSIKQISDAIIETNKDDHKGINSLIELLSIKPAVVPKATELSKESSLILDSLNLIAHRITNLEQANSILKNSNSDGNQYFEINGARLKLGEVIHSEGGRLGKLTVALKEGVIVKPDEGNPVFIHKDSDEYKSILPF